MWLKSVSQKSESTPALTFSRYLLVSTPYLTLVVDLGRRGNMLGCCNQTCGTVQNKQRASRGPVQILNIGLLPSRSVIVYMQEQTRPSVLAILVLRSYI